MVKGEGENILILAGWGTDYKVYKNLAESISNYAKVFYFDMPGFGKSDEPKEPWNVDNYISLVKEFIRQLNIKELSIIGHSNGGRICIKMLSDNNLEFKVKKLILIGSAGIVNKKSLKKRLKIATVKIGKKFLSLPIIKNIFPNTVEKLKNKMGSVDYRNAIWLGYEQIKKDGYINTNTIVKIQGTIEHNNAGIKKLPGTELKNSITGETIYTPPQSEQEITGYLKNLEDFINNNEDGIDPLIKVCLIHYQFESIHPFYDGNGRTGRILNILYLVLNNLIDSPILYLSKYINKTKQEYYKLFNEVRNNNNFEDWILYILKGIEITSKETITLIEKIQNEMKTYKEEFRNKLPKIYSKELLESLFYEVYTKIAYIEKACNVTRITATSYLNQLEEIGLLESEKIGREKLYKNTRLIKLLSES